MLRHFGTFLLLHASFQTTILNNLMKIFNTISAALMAVGVVAVDAEHTSRRLILGGTPVKKNTKTFTAGLRETIDGDFYCGGALVSSLFVLTSVRCAVDLPAIFVSVGTQNRNQQADGEQIEVVSVDVHEKYDNHTGEFDFALLELATPSKYEPIKLPKEDDSDIKTNMTATVVGWGVTSYPDGEYSDVLLEVKLRVWSNEECSQVYTITDTNVCAGGVANKDVCEGDNGGPLIKEHKKGDILIGTVSWGQDCGTEGVPSVFSRVSSAVSWIESIIATR